MTSPSAQPKMPQSYDLKRHIHRNAHRFWCPFDTAGVLTAPVYIFPDQLSFDSDEVQELSKAILNGPLRLPHDRVLFEVPERGPAGGCLVGYVMDNEGSVDALLFRFDERRRRWTDVVVRAQFLPDGVANVEAHPSFNDHVACAPYFQALTGMVWRALGLLSIGTRLREHVVSPLRRTSLVKHGVRGWTYRIAEIDMAQISSAVALRGGTHASPRWHIRRGHWRTLGDGRRVFVRECEVGDQSRGAVLKDYRMGIEEAA